jgi:hypothetical protein
VGHTAGLDLVAKKESLSLLGIEPRSSNRSLVIILTELSRLLSVKRTRATKSIAITIFEASAFNLISFHLQSFADFGLTLMDF